MMYRNTLKLDSYQNTLFPYAYNILGSSEDAKDVVQDVILKNINLDLSGVDNITGYLVKSVINQSINLKKRNSRLTSNKVWLPEPLSTEKADSAINKQEIISYSLLVLLEKLSAKERAVFILKEGFDYSHEEVAEIVDLTIENSRKILSRAKAKLNKERADMELNKDQHAPQYLENYVQIIQNGDVSKLEKLLANDISLAADGGQKVAVVSEYTTGRDATLDLLLYVYKTFQKRQEIKVGLINHQPALLFYKGERLKACQVFEIRNNLISKIFAIVDPKKLSTLD